MSDGLAFEQVSRRFGSLEALQSLDLRCPPGSSTCIIGPNGAGKSTALALATGLLRPTSGRVTLNGVQLTDLACKDALGFLPQRSTFPGSLRPREILDLCQHACSAPRTMYEAVMHLGGLAAVLDKPVRELSGGWVRRLGLACALIAQAPILLLDEPFVGLDPDTLDRLCEHLRLRSRDGAIVVMTSHAFEEIDGLEPQLAVLNGGRLLTVAPPGSDQARTLYRRMLAHRAANPSGTEEG